MLIVAPIEPYPPDAGWPIVIYNDIVGLRALGNEVRVLAVTNSPQADSRAMERICPTEYVFVPKQARWWQVLKNVGRPLPFSIARYVSKDVSSAIHRFIHGWSADIVLIEDIAMAMYGLLIRKSLGVPFFVRGHNLDTQVFRRFVATQGNAVLRFVGTWQCRKMKKYEGSTLALADGFSMISEQDAAESRRLFPKLEPEIVEAGTDLEMYKPPERRRQPLVLMHVGSLTAFTKLEGMLWFVREVFGKVRAQYPGAVLELVGRLQEKVFANRDGVTVVGTVADERPHLHRGRVFIAPQFVGSGVRLKLLNAMATGNAIVCTSVACEGVPVVDGEHMLIRDRAEDFADAVISLLRDEHLADRLGRNARELVEGHYAWGTVTARLNDALRRTVRRRIASQHGT